MHTIRAGHAQGLTLTELITVVAIVSITLSIGAPAMNEMLERREVRASIETLRHLMFVTRSHAILSGSTTVLCPLTPTNECKRDWNLPLTAFADPNGNRKLDSDELVLGQMPASQPDSRRSYPRTGFVINNKGFAGGNNGTLGYCRLLSSGERVGASFIVSRMGRIRPGDDKNNNGIPENASGKDVDCL
jgi:type IV fimbrial biogenesis protein FimT